MAIDGVSEEQRTFESMQAELLRTDLGRFAVLCGRKLLGVYESIDDALLASSKAFDARTLPEGAPVLISEIAERVQVRVMARPYVHHRGSRLAVAAEGREGQTGRPGGARVANPHPLR
jgi:hypothetical protein